MPTPQPNDLHLAELLSVIGQPVRLTLLRYLLEEEHCVTQCMQHTGHVQSLVSKHLNRLVQVGLVQRRRVGRRQYHRVVAPERVRGLLAAAEGLFVAAEGSPDRVGDALPGQPVADAGVLAAQVHSAAGLSRDHAAPV